MMAFNLSMHVVVLFVDTKTPRSLYSKSILFLYY